jgi:DNA-binding GntR family transcriptional regulator
MSLPDRSDQIDRSRIEQVWEQVAAMIRADIADGTFPAGYRLPSETEIAQQYGVARMTARKALATLIADGLLVVIRGRGTYVARVPDE